MLNGPLTFLIPAWLTELTHWLFFVFIVAVIQSLWVYFVITM